METNGNENHQEPEPRFIPGRMGTRQYSIAALVERIVSAFEQEHGTDSPALLECETSNDRLKLLRDVVNYVLAVESVKVAPEDQAEITRLAYSDLFTYGPLDAYFADEHITTIALEGIEKASVRYGHSDLISVGQLFEDAHQFRRLVDRLIKNAGAEIRAEQPYIEAGVQLESGRRVCVNLVSPPVSPQLMVDLRVHPLQLPALETVVESAQARDLLQAIASSPHGFVVVGEAESGKTTLLGMMASMAKPASCVAVERAGELFLPEGAERLTVQWPVGEREGISFSQQAGAALMKNPACILLDEARADESHAVTPMLAAENAPRQMWAFRGPADSKRLSSALGMLARRGDPSQSEELVRALYERLPFVIVIRRRKDRLQLHSISEWQFKSGTGYPDYVELMTQGWEWIELTGKRPSHALNLPDSFWG